MEIERQFLIDAFPDLPELYRAQVCQGYLSTAPVVRIRRFAYPDGSDKYEMTVKGKGTMVRAEVNIPIDVASVCASFQQALVDVLVNNTLCCAKNKNLSTVAIAGGVAANTSLRKAMSHACNTLGYNCYYPDPILCTDNAAMIACAGYYEYLNNNISDMLLNAYPSLKLH